MQLIQQNTPPQSSLKLHIYP